MVIKDRFPLLIFLFSVPHFCLILQPNYVLQTDEHRAGLLAKYGPEKLFQAERNFNAAQDLDVSVLEGDIVGVIKQQDPMGSQNRWLIDNGGLYHIICVWYMCQHFLKYILLKHPLFLFFL